MAAERGTLIGLLVLGLLMWLAGAANVIGGSHVLSVILLLAGGLQIVMAGFPLIDRRSPGASKAPREHSLGLYMSCALGLASLGLAISPITRWLLPAVYFVVGGLALIAWAPQIRTRG